MIPYPEVLSRIPFENLEALDDYSVRFSYPRGREVPLHWEMVFDERPDLELLEPDATNRGAIETQLAGLRHAVVESFEQGQGSALFTTAGIDDAAKWRDLLVDLYCRPQALYTNTQRTFAILELPGPRFRVAEFPSLQSLHEFRTLYIRSLPDPDQIVDFGHLDAAEMYVTDQLSQLELRSIPLRKGDKRRMLLLQSAGSRPGRGGMKVSLYLAHLEGSTALLEFEPDGCDAYTVLNQLDRWFSAKVLRDYKVQSCATCSAFRFSGMARDSSSGKKGYCRRRREAARVSGLPMAGLDTRPRHGTVVRVFDRCGQYEFIADEEREIEYCRQSHQSSAS